MPRACSGVEFPNDSVVPSAGRIMVSFGIGFASVEEAADVSGRESDGDKGVAGSIWVGDPVGDNGGALLLQAQTALEVLQQYSKGWLDRLGDLRNDILHSNSNRDQTTGRRLKRFQEKESNHDPNLHLKQNKGKKREESK